MEEGEKRRKSDDAIWEQRIELCQQFFAGIGIYVNKFDDGTGDLRRERKDSFYWYKRVIETNGAEL